MSYPVKWNRFLCARTDVIPQQFHKASGLSSHQFRIGNGLERYGRGEISAWPCEILRNNVWSPVAVPIDRFPSEVEALAILASLDGETEREGRYINVHSAYEAVVKSREVELSAIRHALAHPITRLTRPDVRAAIEKHFGGMRIDLSLYEHKKPFFVCIGRMLIAIDNALFAVFNLRWKELISDGA